MKGIENADFVYGNVVLCKSLKRMEKVSRKNTNEIWIKFSNCRRMKMAFGKTHKMSDSHRCASTRCEIVHCELCAAHRLRSGKWTVSMLHASEQYTSRFISINGKLSRRIVRMRSRSKTHVDYVHLHSWREHFTWLLWNPNKALPSDRTSSFANDFLIWSTKATKYMENCIHGKIVFLRFGLHVFVFVVRGSKPFNSHKFRMTTSEIPTDSDYLNFAMCFLSISGAMAFRRIPAIVSPTEQSRLRWTRLYILCA